MLHEILHLMGLCPDNFNPDILRSFISSFGNIIHIIQNLKIWRHLV